MILKEMDNKTSSKWIRLGTKKKWTSWSHVRGFMTKETGG